MAGAQAIFQEVREVEGAAGPAGELPVYHQQLEAKVLSIPVKARLLAVNTGKTGVVVVAAASAASELPLIARCLLPCSTVSASQGRPSRAASRVTSAAPAGVRATAPAKPAPTLAPPVTPLPADGTPRFTVANANINVRSGPGRLTR